MENPLVALVQSLEKTGVIPTATLVPVAIPTRNRLVSTRNQIASDRMSLHSSFIFDFSPNPQP
jgi:hypothetical protein